MGESTAERVAALLLALNHPMERKQFRVSAVECHAVGRRTQSGFSR